MNTTTPDTRRQFLKTASAAGLAATGAPAFAHQFEVGSITIGHPWTRATPPSATVGAGYASFTNRGKTADRLIGATSPVAAKVELHSMTMDGGIMKMRPLPDGIEIPAGGTASLAPGGNHLMLIGLKAPLVKGTMVPLKLQFAKAGTVKVELKVEAVGASEPAHEH